MQHVGDEFHGMLSASPVMHRLFTTIERAARSDAAVLVRGETGSGKELVARALHDLSPRAGRPFLAVNCATLTGDLLASELFGHVRGAFTGAVRDRKGLFARADGGTVFLDEIGELPLDIQPRLLRVLQEKRFSPVGGSESIRVDVRLISATHRALRREVQAGRFRADLMFRIRVAPLFIPPLRERPEDVELLVRHFMRVLSDGARDLHDVAPDALAAMQAYPWPGNVRELRNIVESALALGEGPVLTLDDLPPELRGEPPPTEVDALDATLAQRERAELIDALGRARGNRTRAAELLGISRTTLWRKLRELAIDTRG
ncbi:MAG: sigma 54-interacting transcriptional regulator [Alphaproteobacteria bacterium]|nr:sigma 54-interacting transcriptional regulator [Alphaproteobacteria bacterium]